MRSLRILIPVLAGALVMPAVAAAAAAPAGQRTTLHPYQHLTVTGGGGRKYVVRDDAWGTRQILVNHDRAANFRVVHRTRWGNGLVKSFPNIFYGWEWGVHSPRTVLPARARAVRGAKVSWYTREHSGGCWNAAIETWWARRNIKSGQAGGAELMIWLNTHRFGLRRGTFTNVKVGGHWFHLLTWIARSHHSGKTWRYIQFRFIHRRWTVRRLPLGPFIRFAEHRGWIKPRWYLTSIEGGFEIWSGGAGLATTWFGVWL